jgi:hypothetical protein
MSAGRHQLQHLHEAGNDDTQQGQKKPAFRIRQAKGQTEKGKSGNMFQAPIKPVTGLILGGPSVRPTMVAIRSHAANFAILRAIGALVGTRNR